MRRITSSLGRTLFASWVRWHSMALLDVQVDLGMRWSATYRLSSACSPHGSSPIATWMAVL
eukprot:12438958-Prorocentrum_lima.AAC.1